MPEAIIRQIYCTLYDSFGPQHWWPGETPFEVIIGAILTQNTNWRNVERALANLKDREALTASALRAMPADTLAQLIRPAGYFNVKARRIKNFIEFLFENYEGRLNAMAKVPTGRLREEILAVNGIGPETADSILLYALNRPVFVIDAYTKRILYRHGLVGSGAGYADMQEIFRRTLEEDLQLFNEYHALIVRAGKDFCRPVPRCEECPLNTVSYSVTRRCAVCFRRHGNKERVRKGTAGRTVCGECHGREMSSA